MVRIDSAVHRTILVVDVEMFGDRVSSNACRTRYRASSEPTEARALDGLGHCAAASAEPDTAAACFREALAIFERIGAAEAVVIAERVGGAEPSSLV